MFYELSQNQIMDIDGGASLEHIAAGVTFIGVGVGCLAIAATPGVNVIAAATVAYAGSWGIAGGITSTIYGCVKK